MAEDAHPTGFWTREAFEHPDVGGGLGSLQRQALAIRMQAGACEGRKRRLVDRQATQNAAAFDFRRQEFILRAIALQGIKEVASAVEIACRRSSHLQPIVTSVRFADAQPV